MGKLCYNGLIWTGIPKGTPIGLSASTEIHDKSWGCICYRWDIVHILQIKKENYV